MKITTCDQCHAVCDDTRDIVELKGYHNPNSGGILLPERFSTFQFCKPECFLNWMAKQLEEDPRMP